jgi:hypothetical protein
MANISNEAREWLKSEMGATNPRKELALEVYQALNRYKFQVECLYEDIHELEDELEKDADDTELGRAVRWADELPAYIFKRDIIDRGIDLPIGASILAAYRTVQENSNEKV